MLDDMRGELFRELGSWDRQKTRTPTWRAGECFEYRDDGKPLGHEEADAIGRRVSLLLQRGEWSRAVAALQLAYAETIDADDSDAVESLELDTHAVNLLAARKLTTVTALAKLTDDQLLELPGVGPVVVRRIRAAMARRDDQRLAMKHRERQRSA